MAKSHLEKTLTALSGEFSVARQLCLKGHMATLTLKNYPELNSVEDSLKSNPESQHEMKQLGRALAEVLCDM